MPRNIILLRKGNFKVDELYKLWSCLASNHQSDTYRGQREDMRKQLLFHLIWKLIDDTVILYCDPLLEGFGGVPGNWPVCSSSLASLACHNSPSLITNKRYLSLTNQRQLSSSSSSSSSVSLSLSLSLSYSLSAELKSSSQRSIEYAFITALCILITTNNSIQ